MTLEMAEGAQDEGQNRLRQWFSLLPLIITAEGSQEHEIGTKKGMEKSKA